MNETDHFIRINHGTDYFICTAGAWLAVSTAGASLVRCKLAVGSGEMEEFSLLLFSSVIDVYVVL